MKELQKERTDKESELAALQGAVSKMPTRKTRQEVAVVSAPTPVTQQVVRRTATRADDTFRPLIRDTVPRRTMTPIRAISPSRDVGRARPVSVPRKPEPEKDDNQDWEFEVPDEDLETEAPVRSVKLGKSSVVRSIAVPLPRSSGERHNRSCGCGGSKTK